MKFGVTSYSSNHAARKSFGRLLLILRDDMSARLSEGHLGDLDWDFIYAPTMMGRGFEDLSGWSTRCYHTKRRMSCCPVLDCDTFIKGDITTRATLLYDGLLSDGLILFDRAGLSLDHKAAFVTDLRDSLQVAIAAELKATGTEELAAPERSNSFTATASRLLHSAPERVFAALTDPEARRALLMQNSSGLHIDEINVFEGGTEKYHARHKGSTLMCVTRRFQTIQSTLGTIETSVLTEFGTLSKTITQETWRVTSRDGGSEVVLTAEVDSQLPVMISAVVAGLEADLKALDYIILMQDADQPAP